MNLPSTLSTHSVFPWLSRHAWLMSFVSSTLLHVGAVGWLWWSITTREDLVILRYNAYLGIDLLGVWWQAFLVPAVTFFFTLFNLGLAKLLERRGFPEVVSLFFLGNFLLSGAVVVVAWALSFINV